jgi:hypothetical protein
LGGGGIQPLGDPCEQVDHGLVRRAGIGGFRHAEVAHLAGLDQPAHGAGGEPPNRSRRGCYR